MTIALYMNMLYQEHLIVHEYVVQKTIVQIRVVQRTLNCVNVQYPQTNPKETKVVSL